MHVCVCVYVYIYIYIYIKLGILPPPKYDLFFPLILTYFLRILSLHLAIIFFIVSTIYKNNKGNFILSDNSDFPSQNYTLKISQFSELLEKVKIGR